MLDSIRFGKYDIGVLYEDNHLLCVLKPANLPVQADASGDADLLNILKGYIERKYNKAGRAYLGLVHRLDRPVGGVMAFARTSKAAARLSAQFAAHTARKQYFAVLEGELKAALELNDYILTDVYTGIVRAARADEMGAKLARLTSAPLAIKDGLTLSNVNLLTGRKHQIRVQHALAGYPLWGDARYGNGGAGNQIALWAHTLEFEHPTLKTPVKLSAPPPDTGIWARFKHELRDNAVYI